MFSNKIVTLVLCLMLPVPNTGWAGDAIPGTQILIERAHYWDKLGRYDMARQVWQELLRIDPANAEALAAVSKAESNPPQPEPQAINAVQDATVNQANKTVAEPSRPPETVVKPVAEPISASVEPRATVETVQPVVSPAPVKNPGKVQSVVKRVEDWPDLFSGGVNSLSDSTNASAQSVLPQSADAQPDLANVSDEGRVNHSLLADPSVSAVTEDGLSVKTEPVKTIQPVAEQTVTTAAVAAQEQAQPPQAVPALPVHVLADTREKIDKTGRAYLPRGLNINSSRDEWQANFGSSQSELDAGQGGPLTADDNPKSLADRAAYWDKHGRADLADKLRKQSADSGQAVTTAVPHESIAAPPSDVTANTPAQSGLVADSPATPGDRQGSGRADLAPQSAPADSTPTAGTLPNSAQVQNNSGTDSHAGVLQADAPPKPDAEERARYWEAHGRSDLAAQIRRQASPKMDETSRMTSASPDGAMFKEVPEVPADVQLGAQQSKVDLDEKAQYWEAHGRSDLAGELRKQLAKSDQAANGSASTPRLSAEVSARDIATRSVLEDSLLKNPGSLKTRLDLAQIYRGAGENAKSRMLIDSVLTDSPDLPEAIFASAQLYAQQRLWWETLHALEKVSPVSRTDEMARLQKTAWAHVQIDRADALVRQGRNLEAEVLLRRVAAELVVNDNQAVQPEPPPLWKSAVQQKTKR